MQALEATHMDHAVGALRCFYGGHWLPLTPLKPSKRRLSSTEASQLSAGNLAQLPQGQLAATHCTDRVKV